MTKEKIPHADGRALGVLRVLLACSTALTLLLGRSLNSMAPWAVVSFMAEYGFSCVFPHVQLWADPRSARRRQLSAPFLIHHCTITAITLLNQLKAKRAHRCTTANCFSPTHSASRSRTKAIRDRTSGAFDCGRPICLPPQNSGAAGRGNRDNPPWGGRRQPGHAARENPRGGFCLAACVSCPLLNSL